MPTYYFEIEVVTIAKNKTIKGWLRIEADTLEEATDDVLENGFNASDIIGSKEQKEVTVLDGGEEEE